LGTSTAEEGAEYFEAMSKHKKVFKYIGDEDDKPIETAFGKAGGSADKEWMNKHEPGTGTNFWFRCNGRRT